MSVNESIREALDAVERLGIEVRRERLGGNGGGLCRLRDRQVFFVDLDADQVSLLDELARTLAESGGAESFFLSPSLRNLIERARQGNQ